MKEESAEQTDKNIQKSDGNDSASELIEEEKKKGRQ